MTDIQNYDGDPNRQAMASRAVRREVWLGFMLREQIDAGTLASPGDLHHLIERGHAMHWTMHWNSLSTSR